MSRCRLTVFVTLVLVGTCLLLPTLTWSSKVAAQGQASGIAKARVEEIAELFVGAGISRSAIQSIWRDDPELADGIDDWRSRRVTVRVEP